MVEADRNWFMSTGNGVRDAIAAVRGRQYTVEPAVLLYPTSGTSKDFSYARHIVNTGHAKVFSYTLETGREFQPPDAEAAQVINEVCAALLQFCVSVLCLVESVAADALDDAQLNQLRTFRDDVLATSSVGRQYLAQLDQHTPELVEAFGADAELRKAFVGLLRKAGPVLSISDKVPEELLRHTDRFVETLGKSHRTAALRATLHQVRSDLRHFAGRTVRDGLDEVERARRVRPDKPAKQPVVPAVE